MDSLSSALQSGDLSSAQTAFATPQQDLQQFAVGSSSGTTSGSTTASTSSQTNGSNLNVTVSDSAHFQKKIQVKIGIGEAVARSPLPHHPTCGSASGGSEGYARPWNSRGSPTESK